MAGVSTVFSVLQLIRYRCIRQDITLRRLFGIVFRRQASRGAHTVLLGLTWSLTG